MTAVLSITERLVAGPLARPVAQADRERAALHLLDWIGCALAGAVTAEGRALACFEDGSPFAAVYGDFTEHVATMGCLGSLLEMDDVHRGALLHPGPVIVPVVLGLGGYGDPLSAMVLGYEAMIRLGRSVGPGHYAMFHNTATCGGMGAAVAATVRIGGANAQMVGAIGTAMSLAGGLWQCRHEDVATKHIHVAEAARRGCVAMWHAMAGLPGPRFILDGPQGFFAALARDGDPERVLEGPDDPWLIHEVSFKPWPACRHAHPAIDAALVVRARLGGRVAEAVQVATYADAIRFCDKPAPKTPAEARFSLQHAVAVALRDGPPGLAAFEASALAVPFPLRDRVTVAAEDEFSAAYPAHFGARVTVTAGGETLTATVTDAWGDSENPMPPTAIQGKFDMLAAHAGVPRATADALAAATLALPEGGPVEDLLTLMRAVQVKGPA